MVGDATAFLYWGQPSVSAPGEANSEEPLPLPARLPHLPPAPHPAPRPMEPESFLIVKRAHTLISLILNFGLKREP